MTAEWPAEVVEKVARQLKGRLRAAASTSWNASWMPSLASEGVRSDSSASERVQRQRAEGRAAKRLRTTALSTCGDSRTRTTAGAQTQCCVAQ